MITKEAINSIRNHACEISKLQDSLKLEIDAISNDLLDWAESNLEYLDCLNDDGWNVIPRTNIVISVDKDGIVSLYNHTYGSYNSEFEFSYSFNSDWLIYPESFEKRKEEVEKNKRITMKQLNKLIIIWETVHRKWFYTKRYYSIICILNCHQCDCNDETKNKILDWYSDKYNVDRSRIIGNWCIELNNVPVSLKIPTKFPEGISVVETPVEYKHDMALLFAMKGFSNLGQYSYIDPETFTVRVQDLK